MRHLPPKSSPTITISYRITRTRKEWAVRGEMTIQTISKQHTGGVTKKKDQPEWMANGRSSMPPGPTRASLRIQARDKLMYKSKLMRGWPERIRLVATEQQSLIEVAKSTDFGATSTKPSVIANTTNAGTDKDIVVVNGRDVYVGYNHAQTVRVSSSHDGGHTFTSANVNHNAQFGWLSDQQSSNRQCWQRLLLVGGLYQNGGAKGPVNIYVSKSSDGGNTWTETLVDISGSPPDCSAFLCGWAFLGPGTAMTNDVAGNLYLLWNAGNVDKGPERIFYSTSTDGVNWSPKLDVSLAPAGVPQARISSIVGTPAVYCLPSAPRLRA